MQLIDRIRCRLKGKKRVVYTCMFGYSEPFSDFPIEIDHKTDAICFTDDHSLKSDSWQFRYIDTSELGPVRTSKMVKILAHQFVGEYRSSLYIDNRVQPIVPISYIFSHLRQHGSPMITFQHPERVCAYAESEVIVERGIDNAQTVRDQMAKYRNLGFPTNAGLIAGTVLLRRHNNPIVRTIMEQWFAEVKAHSYRDQLSFDFVAWTNKFQPNSFCGEIHKNHLVNWPVAKGPRLPRAFCDATYLALNPDISLNGMSAREHYMKAGVHEGRPWR